MKIPTLIALLLLIIALTLGLATYYYHQKIQLQRKQLFQPKNSMVVNLTDNSASIFWQTDIETQGQLLYGQNKFDQTIKYDKSTNHLVSLTNLNPSSNITFKILANDFLYDNLPSFQTPAKISGQENVSNQPVFGTVVDLNLEPIDQAVVLLKVDGAQTLAGLTSNKGSFLIPLKDLRTQDLTNFFNLKDKTAASLKIIKDDQTSEIKITLPLGNAVLPPLLLGQDLDLTQFIASSSSQTAKPKLEKVGNLTEKKASPNDPLDLNSDGKINVVDISIVFQSFGKITVKTAKADINHDGTIDQKDVDLIKKALQ